MLKNFFKIKEAPAEPGDAIADAEELAAELLAYDGRLRSIMALEVEGPRRDDLRVKLLDNAWRLRMLQLVLYQAAGINRGRRLGRIVRKG